MNYVTKTFLLVSSSVSSIQQLCFVYGQGQKREQKVTTENFVEFHNNPLLLTNACTEAVGADICQIPGSKRSSLSCNTIEGCSTHKSSGLEAKTV